MGLHEKGRDTTLELAEALCWWLAENPPQDDSTVKFENH